MDVPRAKGILEKWFSITEVMPPSCFSAYVLNGKSLYILLTNCEEQNSETQNIISELSSLVERTTRGKQVPLPQAAKVFYGEKSPVYFKNSSAGMYKSFGDIKDCIETVLEKVTSTPGMIYQVNTLGGKIDDANFAVQSSYSHRGQKYLSELQTYWQQASQTDKMVKAFEDVQQIFYAGGIRQQYRNYPDINLKDWASAYYGDNYSRLQKVKARYDPENIFRYEQSVTPLNFSKVGQ
ncbi:MAG: BBE domain-containing protein [Ginsengibacter sp.]